MATILSEHPVQDAVGAGKGCCWEIWNWGLEADRATGSGGGWDLGVMGKQWDAGG